jgi:hypothetical protein
MTARKAGRILTAIAFASMIGGLSVGTAQADDNNWRREQQQRNERDRHDHNAWHEVYRPVQSPGIRLFFPFFR